MKILVDKDPKVPNECMFAEYDRYIWGYKCILKSDNISIVCSLENNESCPFLVGGRNGSNER